MSQELLVTLLLPLLLQSVGGYAWLALHVSRRGGYVRTAAVGMPDLMLCTVLVLGLIQLTWLTFNSPALPPEKLLTVTAQQILEAPLFQAAFSCCIASFLVFRRISLVEFFGLRQVSPARVLLWAVPLLLLALPAVLALSSLVTNLLLKEVSGAGGEQFTVKLFRSLVQNDNVAGIAAIYLAAVVLAPFSEELLFRGYFYPVGKRYFGAVPSAFLTAVLFAFVHANVASFAPLFLLALCWTICYEKTGSLLVPIAMHATFNCFQLTLLLLSPTIFTGTP